MAESKLNPQEEIIKRYLDEQSTKDEALRALYVPSKIKDCFKYITEQARKQAVNRCAFVDDAVVYKWARDYYLEELPKTATKEDVKIITEPIIQQKKSEVVTEKNGVKYDSDGCGLFDFGD